MLNDIRVQVRRSAATVREAGDNINEHLPEIVAKSKSTTAILSQNLPEVVDKVRKTTDTVTESLPEVVERVERTTEVMAELAAFAFLQLRLKAPPLVFRVVQFAEAVGNLHLPCVDFEALRPVWLIRLLL